MNAPTNINPHVRRLKAERDEAAAEFVNAIKLRLSSYLGRDMFEYIGALLSDAFEAGFTDGYSKGVSASADIVNEHIR